MITFESKNLDKVINGPTYDVFDSELTGEKCGYKIETTPIAKLHINLASGTFSLYHPTDYFLEVKPSKEVKMAICDLLSDIIGKYVYKPETKKYYTGIGKVTKFDFDEVDRVVYVDLGGHELVFPTYEHRSNRYDPFYVLNLHIDDLVSVGYDDDYFLYKKIEESHRNEPFKEGEEIIPYWVKK